MPSKQTVIAGVLILITLVVHGAYELWLEKRSPMTLLDERGETRGCARELSDAKGTLPADASSDA